MPEGGHFAAFEQPKLLYDDIVQFVKKVEKKAKNNANKAELWRKIKNVAINYSWNVCPTV